VAGTATVLNGNAVSGNVQHLLQRGTLKNPKSLADFSRDPALSE
jgi:hypothetical protein